MKSYIKIDSFKIFNPWLMEKIATSNRGKSERRSNEEYNAAKLRRFKPLNQIAKEHLRAIQREE